MYEYNVKEVVKVVDGDTLDVLIDVGFSVFLKQRVRLKGVNTPEIHFANNTEKQSGEAAKTYVLTWLSENSKLQIKTYKDDKYGRLLADLISVNTNQSLNDALIQTGHAVPYDGKSKL